MNRERLTPPPGFLNNAVLANMPHLLNHVEFAQTVDPILNARQGIEYLLMPVTDILNVSKPVAEQSKAPSHIHI